jgi:hypothetical protein
VRRVYTPAITEYSRQTETVKYLQTHCSQAQSDNEALRRELHQTRIDFNQLQAEFNALQQHQSSAARVPAQGLTDPFTTEQYSRAAAPRPELPPLRALSTSIQNVAPAPESMTGVQFEQPRPNGFPRSERF